MPSVSFSKSQEKKIVKLFIKDRMSTPAIGRLYGVSHNHIMSVIKSSGVQYSLGERRTKLFTDRQKADIVKMYSGGLGSNTKFIGEKYGCSYAQGLTVFDLAHPCNLRLLPALDNLCKYKKSDQTKQELLRKIRSWNKEKGDPYQGLNIEVKYQYKYGRYRLVD